MHIQVTIISRLKAATFEAKGRGKAAQRESGGREVERETENFSFFLNSLWARLTSHPEQSGQKALGKKKKILLPKRETVPERTSPSREAVINSERLLLHQAIWLCHKEFSSCCWAKIPVRSHSPQRHYSLANVIAPFFSPSLLFASRFIYLQAVCCTARCKNGSARSLREAERQHPCTTDAQKLVSLCLQTVVLCVRLEGSTWQKLLDWQPGRLKASIYPPAGRAQTRFHTLSFAGARKWESHDTD